MPNYLNPTIVELDDVNFEKIDFAPGTGVFRPADFAILDAGSMQNLNITVDRDGERYTKQLQGVCFVDSWAVNRGDDAGIPIDIDNTLAPVDSPNNHGHGNYGENVNPYEALTGLPTNNMTQLEAGPDPAIFASGVVQSGQDTNAASEPALAVRDDGSYCAFRGEMQLRTTVADSRGYDFVDSVQGGGAAVPNPPSSDGAGNYEFLTEPKFTEDVTYMTTDSGELLYSDAKRGTASSYKLEYLATDENGDVMPYVPITGIEAVERDAPTPSADDPNVLIAAAVGANDSAALLKQSNSIMHVNITRDIKHFDINQTPEAFDQRRKRGTRDLLQGIVFCSMVKKIFNTGETDSDLELKNVDFSSPAERESGLFFVNIEDSEVVNSSGIMLQQGNSTEQYPNGVGKLSGYASFAAWITDKLGAAARSGVTYSDGDYVDAGETKREFDLRLEFLRLTDPSQGTISDFQRNANGQQLYVDASGVETHLPRDDNEVDNTPLYTYSEVIEGSGKDRTYTIPNDVLHKTLLAFNGYKRGRRAIDVDEEHGKIDISGGDWDDADTGAPKVVTTPSEWYPPAALDDANPVNNRVNGPKIDDEIGYWNFRTSNGDSGAGDDWLVAGMTTDAVPNQELEYVPFQRYDKMMVYYTIDIYFQQKSLAEITPDGLNALTIEGSTSTETGDVVTTEGAGNDFYDTQLSFILEWVLSHNKQREVGKRNSSLCGTQTATAAHYQTVPGKRNVWEDDYELDATS